MTSSSSETIKARPFDPDHAEKLANVVAGPGTEIPTEAGDRVSFIMATLVLQAVAEVRKLRSDAEPDRVHNKAVSTIASMIPAYGDRQADLLSAIKGMIRPRGNR